MKFRDNQEKLKTISFDGYLKKTGNGKESNQLDYILNNPNSKSLNKNSNPNLNLSELFVRKSSMTLLENAYQHRNSNDKSSSQLEKNKNRVDQNPKNTNSEKSQVNLENEIPNLISKSFISHENIRENIHKSKRENLNISPNNVSFKIE